MYKGSITQSIDLGKPKRGATVLMTVFAKFPQKTSYKSSASI